MALTAPPVDLYVSWSFVVVPFVARVEQAARGLPIQPTSWYRTPADNRRVGGHDESQHLFALGVDVVGPRASLAVFRDRARRLGLTAVDETDHSHVQAFPRGALARAGVEFPS